VSIQTLMNALIPRDDWVIFSFTTRITRTQMLTQSRFGNFMERLSISHSSLLQCKL